MPQLQTTAAQVTPPWHENQTTRPPSDQPYRPSLSPRPPQSSTRPPSCSIETGTTTAETPDHPHDHEPPTTRDPSPRRPMMLMPQPQTTAAQVTPPWHDRQIAHPPSDQPHRPSPSPRPPQSSTRPPSCSTETGTTTAETPDRPHDHEPLTTRDPSPRHQMMLTPQLQTAAAQAIPPWHENQITRPPSDQPYRPSPSPRPPQSSTCPPSCSIETGTTTAETPYHSHDHEPPTTRDPSPRRQRMLMPQLQTTAAPVIPPWHENQTTRPPSCSIETGTTTAETPDHPHGHEPLTTRDPSPR